MPLIAFEQQRTYGAAGRPGADACHAEICAGSLNYKSPQAIRSRPAQGDTKDAAKALLSAENPVLWAGQGVLMARATEQLRELAERVGAPVFCTMAAVGLTARKVGEMADALVLAKRLNADGQTVLIDVHSNMEPGKFSY